MESVAWSTEIVAVPAPTIETTAPEIVATFVSLEVYVNAPVEFELGGVIVKLASPNVLLIAVILPKVGAILFTVNVVEVVASR